MIGFLEAAFHDYDGVIWTDIESGASRPQASAVLQWAWIREIKEETK